MKIQGIKTIHGPNVFHHRPVLIMTLKLGEFTEVASTDLPGFSERLVAWLPGLKSHHCSPGRPGGFVERLHRGTYMGHIVEHIALELSSLAGIEVTYGKTVYAGEEGLYNVIVRFANEEGMKYLLTTAVELASAAARGAAEFNLSEAISSARALIGESELGPSTRAIVEAATKRNIPWRRLNEMNLIQFGYGCRRRLIQATTTSETSDIAVDIAQDKQLTKKFLDDAGIFVPRGLIAHNESEALAAFQTLRPPVVLKPVDGNHGRGVCLNLRTPAEVAAAYQLAARHSQSVLVEEYLEGKDFRVLIVGGKMAAAAERVPAHVFGDGKSTLAQLIDVENANPVRGEGHEKPMTKISLDAETFNHLARTGMTMESVPKFRQQIFLKATANLSTDGIAIDVTDEVHPEIRRMCERAARLVGLDICGVDLIARDISSAPAKQAGVVEVNAGPGIRMHIYPSKGKSRDVGRAIVDMLYPDDADARIPITAITGTNGKTTVTRLVSYVLQRAGRCVGMTTTDGIYVDGVRIAEGDTTGPISARTVLADPQVDTAVLETARGGIIKRGLGFDWCDVGVITNIREDHIGQDGIEDLRDILRIKSLVVERVREGGTIVLNADDALLVENARVWSPGRKLIYFSLDPHNSVLTEHIRAGGTAYFENTGWICESREGLVRRLIHTSEIPLTLFGTAQFQTANVLAVVAAALANHAPYDVLLKSLREFRSNENNSGRANLYKVGDGYAMLDYGHNPDAFQSICAMTARWTTHRTVGVIGVPGDRSDRVIVEAAKAAAQGFDRVYLRDDLDLRGRAPGAAPEVFRRALAAAAPALDCRVILDEQEAMKTALSEIRDHEICVIFYDDLTLAQRILSEMGAQPLTSAESMRLFSDELRPLELKPAKVPRNVREDGQVEFAR